MSRYIPTVEEYEKVVSLMVDRSRRDKSFTQCIELARQDDADSHKLAIAAEKLVHGLGFWDESVQAKAGHYWVILPDDAAYELLQEKLADKGFLSSVIAGLPTTYALEEAVVTGLNSPANSVKAGSSALLQK